MKLIIGGAYQGKTAYVHTKLGIDMRHILKIEESQDMESAVTALCDATADLKCVVQFHLLIRYAMERVWDIDDFVEKMLHAHPHIIIVMDEVGSGIIPLEKAEREYREQVGRTGCMLAERANQMIRVICGIGTKLKDIE